MVVYRASLLVLAVTSCMFLGGCYLAKQGKYVFTYNHSAVSIKKMQENPQTPQKTMEFLDHVQAIRNFAIKDVGLKDNDNFSRYVKIDKHYLINVVCAAGKDNFTPYTWCFPFFGCFPYKGFFDSADAEKEASFLDKKGYDVYIGKADDFSTLGILSDPVYSFMERFSVFRLASLIIHEQTHATFFMKNQVQFNEQVATFFGNEGGLSFIRKFFGDTSAQFTEGINSLRDEEAYISLIHSLYRKLDTLYRGAASPEEKLARKAEIIGRFKDSLSISYDQIFRTLSYKGLEHAPINNAFISVDLTYTLDLKDFYALYEKRNRDLAQTLKSILSLKGMSGNPLENLRKVVQSP